MKLQNLRSKRFIFIGNSPISELPTSIQFDIKVNGITALNYAFTAAYNSAGMPTSVISDMTIGTFEFKTVWGYQTSDVSIDYTMSDSSKTMVDVGFEMTGNFDKTNIQNFANSQNPDPTTVLTNANAHFQFYNIKIAGQIDFKDFYNGFVPFENSSFSIADTTKLLNLINNNIALVVVYVNSNQMIAKVEPYFKVYQYTEYNKTYTTATPAFRLVFADKSKTDLSTYFQSGFTDLITDFNNLRSELQSTYGNQGGK